MAADPQLVLSDGTTPDDPNRSLGGSATQRLARIGLSKTKSFWKGLKDLLLELTNQSLGKLLQALLLEWGIGSNYLLASAFRSVTSR
jgi:hypothetical protein